MRTPAEEADGEVLNVHASAAVVGERGILLRGASASGKTAVALALAEGARARGLFGRLVADDRVLLLRRGGRLVARPHPGLAGLAERRGFGIVAARHEPACVVALVVDLAVGRPERLPAPGLLHCAIAGIALPRIAVMAGRPPAEAAILVMAALCGVGAAGDVDPISLAKLAAMHKIAPEPNRRAGVPPEGMSDSSK